jgi:hypothetical protein
LLFVFYKSKISIKKPLFLRQKDQMTQKRYQEITTAYRENKELLAVLLGIDEAGFNRTASWGNKSISCDAYFCWRKPFFCDFIKKLISEIKLFTKLPIFLFRGNSCQIARNADGILFLRMLSGRNPDYLIQHQAKSAPLLKKNKFGSYSNGLYIN